MASRRDDARERGGSGHRDTTEQSREQRRDRITLERLLQHVVGAAADADVALDGGDREALERAVAVLLAHALFIHALASREVES